MLKPKLYKIQAKKTKKKPVRKSLQAFKFELYYNLIKRATAFLLPSVTSTI